MGLTDFINVIRIILTILASAFLFGFFVYVMLVIIYNHKRNQSLETDMAKILREGRSNAVKNKMGSLYLSVNFRKLTYIGKIVSSILIKEASNVYRTFVLKTGLFNPYIFIKCNPIDTDKNTGDITIKKWNFVKDEENKFYIENKVRFNTLVKKRDKDTIDVLGKMAPMVHKSILANPIHRIRLREKKLIKLPDEDKRDFFMNK